MNRIAKRLFFVSIVCLFAGQSLISCDSARQKAETISAAEFRNKMKGAWIGQMIGVGWGFPTEFKWIDSIIPLESVPEWKPEMVNQHNNDDLYVEMTFLASMEKHGLDVSIRQAGIDFVNSGYQLWAANRQGRENLRYGIAPPESSHPEFNKHADDIDYQIEADFSGIIAPGMPNVAIALGEKFGHLMNYGDGLYGGQFVGGMYAAAYFENDIHQVINEGLKCIPEQSLYAECIRDVIHWYQENPDDFEKTWNLIMDKYYRTFDNQPFAQKTPKAWLPIEVKINGAFIVMGLLYGEGDMEKTILYSMRCGLDSDCNPSNAAGILGTIIGFNAIPDKFKTALNVEEKFSYSDYSFTKLLDVSEQFAREFIIRNGGSIKTNETGEEIFNVVRQKAAPSPFLPSYEPGQFNADNRYSKEEMARILFWSEKHFEPVADSLSIDMNVLFCAKTVSPHLTEWNSTQNVLRTISAGRDKSVLIEVKEEQDSARLNKQAYLSFRAGHDPGKSWRLFIRSAGDKKTEKVDTLVCDKNSKNGWIDIMLPLPVKAESEFSATIEAKQIEEGAINYWSGFSIYYK